jgi:hypothetical protein
MSFSNGAFRFLVGSAMLLSLLELHDILAFGQGSSTPGVASLTTIVFDPAGAVITNAEITFKGEKTISTKTGQDGSIQVPLPHGIYTVTTSSPGFKTNKITGFSADSAKPPVLKIVLQIARTECNPCLPVDGTAQTITSDLPNVIEPSVPLPLPNGGGFTFFPPAVYMQSFRACSANEPCTRKEKFRVDSVPRAAAS